MRGVCRHCARSACDNGSVQNITGGCIGCADMFNGLYIFFCEIMALTVIVNVGEILSSCLEDITTSEPS